MKKKILIYLGLLTLPLLIAGSLTVGTTGTLYPNSKSVLTFTRSLQDTLILENKNENNVRLYILLNDTGTSVSAAVSATVYDFMLERNDRVILDREALGRFPVDSLGVYTTTSAPRLTRKGW